MNYKVNSLEAFLARYSACQNDELKLLAIKSAIEILACTGVNREKLHTLKVISEKLGISPTTAWRYQLPFVEKHGHKCYLLTECEDYLKSNAFKSLIDSLKKQRRTRRNKASPLKMKQAA